MGSRDTTVPSLRLVSEQILRYNWIHVRDVGDCGYQVVENLLKLSTANQLAEIEQNSPHLSLSTNQIWKQLCINDFVEVRKLVEDGKLLLLESENQDWKSRYFQEEEKKQVKMKLVLEKLRGQYNELDEKKQSRQVQSIDGLRLEKRRKLLNTSSTHSSNSRPKSLLQKARNNTKAITSIYAPKRKSPNQARTVSALVTAFPSTCSSSKRPLPQAKALPSSNMSTSTSTSNPLDSPDHVTLPKSNIPPTTTKRPTIKTTIRTTKTTTRRSSALVLSPNSSSSRQTSFSPPPPPSSSSSSFVVPPARPIAQIPLRARPKTSMNSPPPRTFATSRVISPPPVSANSTSSVSSVPVAQRRPVTTKVARGLFIPKKK